MATGTGQNLSHFLIGINVCKLMNDRLKCE